MKKVEKEAKERAKDYTENKERQIAYECGFLDGADRATEELKEKLAGAERTRDNLRQIGFPTFQSCREIQGVEMFIITDKKLKWADLKKGDLIRNKKNAKVRRVSRIDRNDWRGSHIFVEEGYWLNDFELEQWEKVEK